MKEIWHPEYYPEVSGWSVMKNGFRDSWHHYRKAAQDRCDELNRLDKDGKQVMSKNACSSTECMAYSTCERGGRREKEEYSWYQEFLKDGKCILGIVGEKGDA